MMKKKLRIYANNCKDIIRRVTHNHNHNDDRKNTERAILFDIRIRVNMRRGMNAISKITV